MRLRPLELTPNHPLQDETASVLVENSMYSLSVSDPLQTSNPLVFVSPGFETMSGYSSNELLGKNCQLLQVREEQTGP